MSNRIFLFLGLVIAAVVVARLLLQHDAAERGGLTVGATAPDFSAVAADGQVVRLSDLRGKVVVLDFWATWCGPCRGMIPHERELVKKLQGKPFAFLGVSADEDATKWRAVLQSEQLTWLNALDGPGGPVQALYKVEYYPTIYVLDAAGVIRFKDVRGAELDRAVEQLLAATH